jgi:protein gp37
MADTSIEWTDASWNPVRGCARVSAGCENCYAEQVARRFAGPGMPYEGLVRLTEKGDAL